MTVYIDVLILENMAVNFIILAATSHFSRTKVSTLKLLLGAFVGAAYVVAAFYPGFHICFTLTAKLLLSMVIIAVTFWPEKLREFLRLLAIFYLVSFVFGGAAFALFYFSNSGGSVYNGVFYIESFPLKILVISTVIAYLVIKWSWSFVKSRMIKEDVMVPVCIGVGGKSVSIKGLIDTGNSLRDPISNLPVVVVEYNAVKELLPDEISEVFKDCREENLEMLSDAIIKTDWASRLRLIPFNSLGKENGMLVGFKPDRVEVGDEDERKNYKDVIIGIYNKSLSCDQSYKALLSLELVS